jgi:hypothetical protein
VISPVLLAAFSKVDDGRRHFISFYPCCGGRFFVSCSNSDDGVDALSDWKTADMPKIHPRHFSSIITDISQRFEDIYNESFIAERNGLLEICGGGYRKALEFLVYDYAILKNPSDADSIKKEGQLGNVIKKYLNDETLLAHLHAASWLGNDALHYVKKHPGADVRELVSFIDDVITVIELREKLEEKKILLPDLEKKLSDSSKA